MRKTITITETVKQTREAVITITCDWCGEEFEELGAITMFEIAPSFGSKYDGDVFDFDICDECLEKYFLKGRYDSVSED